MVLLVAEVTKNLTSFLIAESLIEACMLIASTHNVFNSYLYASISSSLSFRPYDWTMEKYVYKNNPSMSASSFDM